MSNPEADGVSMTVSLIQEIQGLKDKFKDEDEEMPSPFQNLEKATVLQECRCFSNQDVVTNNPRKCATLITKLLHIVTQGESLSSMEVTEVFFGVTKLFQSPDPYLRRMMYLFIKEVAETCNPDDVIIVTSSLTKDMNSNDDLYRANAIRVLARIIDSQMLGAIERYIKQAIVDKNSLVSSCALVSGIFLMRISPEVVRRWTNEVQEAVQSNSDMVQYHALSLLYEIKKNDKLAVTKIVTQLTKTSMSSPLGVCLLIRYIGKILDDDISASSNRAVIQFLEASLRHQSEMVIYEAAKALCTLPNMEQRDLNPAITVLQLFLSSPKPTLRYAAMRCLSDVSNRQPAVIVKCNDDMEALISDPNRSIATLAITTLLKTGTESSVDRLMKQISSFMNEIADEFKIVVVTAIRQLCLKYPQKHRVLVGFLAATLREEGGYEFKKAITDSIVELMKAIPETKESSLFHLCEFIEDCEFTALCTQILHLIGSLGPSTTAPARYIRFIYNRVILENATVRAAAVSALSRFATNVPSIRESVCVLLRRSLLDEDDEVRDRVTMSLKALSAAGEVKMNPETGEVLPYNPDDSSQGDGGAIARLMLEPLPMNFNNLERAIKMYSHHGGLKDGKALTLTELPVVEEVQFVKPSKDGALGGLRGQSKTAGSTGPGGSASASSSSGGGLGGEDMLDAAAAVYATPELAELGRVFRSCKPVELTESETEYVVKCIKHIMNDHVILQFDVTNTIPEQKLVNVSVIVEGSEPELFGSEPVLIVPCKELKYCIQGSTFVVLPRNPNVPIIPSSFNCELKFNVIEVDPETGEVEGDEDGFNDNYPLEDLEIVPADFMAKVSLGDFRRAWENMSNDLGENSDGEIEEKFALSIKKIDDAVENTIELLGMQPCEGSDIIKNKQGPHNLYLSGKFVGNISILARCLLQIVDGQMVLRISVRSNNKNVSQMIADCIR
jgi:coatomer protein complex subunit gamma